MITINMAMSAVWALWTIFFLIIAIVDEFKLDCPANKTLGDYNTITGESNEKR